MKVFPILAAILFMASTCKEPTQPQAAECDAGYHPCEGDRNQCCEVTCDDGFHNCGETLTDCCMDSTSHNFTWTIDTLGIYGSYLNDVAIVNENDIWVVGNIETDTGSYNAAHWDGEEWELIKVLSGHTANTGIQYFSENDIWFGQGGLPIQWNGNEYYLYTPANGEHPGQPSIDSIWGPSSSDLYFVGRSGSIVHFDGANFVQMESGTDVDLKDIAGTPDGEHVFAVGWENTGESISLMKNGNSWIEIYSGDSYFTGSSSTYGRVSSVCVLADTAYFTTTAGLLKYNYESQSYTLSAEGQDEFYDYHFVGIKIQGLNDMMLFSRVFSALHFNGSTWNSDESIPEVYNTWSRKGDFNNNLAVIVGYCCGGGHAIVGRGYR